MTAAGDLSLVPRILLATDGGITHILEAYAGERVDLVRLATSTALDPSERRRLGIAAEERALQRVSLLRGRTSGRAFVHARSVVALDRLPEQAAIELEQMGASLLALLAENRIGTFRETIDEWEGLDRQISGRLGHPATQRLLGRTYQIVSGGRPLAWVTEHFSKAGFPHGATGSSGAPAGAGLGGTDHR